MMAARLLSYAHLIVSSETGAIRTYPGQGPGICCIACEKRIAGSPGFCFAVDSTISLALVNLAKSVESPFLWIHQFTLKMVQSWPAFFSSPFSIGLSRLAFLSEQNVHNVSEWRQKDTSLTDYLACNRKRSRHAQPTCVFSK
jgi:hypothetical protein